MERSRPARDALGVPDPLLGILLFLGSDLMLFAGMVSALAVLKARDFGTAGETLIVLLTGGPLLPLCGLVLAASVFLAWREILPGRSPGPVWCRQGAAGLAMLFLALEGIWWWRIDNEPLGSWGLWPRIMAALLVFHGVQLLVAVGLFLRRSREVRPVPQDSHTARTALVYWSFLAVLWPLLLMAVGVA